MINYKGLPSLKALMVLQAVVENKSISKAAKKLNVTHSAISQSIKQLEEGLGYKVLIKVGRNIEPTSNSQEYVRNINDALNNIAIATKRFQQREGSNVVTLKMVSTLALRWFIPQLTHLKSCHPELDIRLASEISSNVHELPSNVDAGIGYGKVNEFSDLHFFKLRNSELVLLSKKPYSNVAIALKENTAIYVDSELRRDDWRDWCQSEGIEQPCLAKRLMFPNSAQALEAVSAGVGVLVSQQIFVEPMIKTSLLYKVGPSLVDKNKGYFFYCRPEITHSALSTLIEWLHINHLEKCM